MHFKSVRKSVRKKQNRQNQLSGKNERTPLTSGVPSGDPSEIRTPDTLIKSQVLCQLS